jgi:polo-like kinase 1
MADFIHKSLLIDQSALKTQCDVVVKFVDFCSKYGLGYKLSNGAYGVLFNDNTKIIKSANVFHFAYIEKKSK